MPYCCSQIVKCACVLCRNVLMSMTTANPLRVKRSCQWNSTGASTLCLTWTQPPGMWVVTCLSTHFCISTILSYNFPINPSIFYLYKIKKNYVRPHFFAQQEHWDCTVVISKFIYYYRNVLCVYFCFSWLASLVCIKVYIRSHCLIYIGNPELQTCYWWHSEWKGLPPGQASHSCILDWSAHRLNVVPEIWTSALYLNKIFSQTIIDVNKEHFHHCS